MAGFDRLTPEGKRFFAQLEELKKLEVRAGFQTGEETDENGTDICDIAAWNELGTENMPARPFLRKSVDENVSKISAFCQAQAKSVAKGGDTRRFSVMGLERIREDDIVELKKKKSLSQLQAENESLKQEVTGLQIALAEAYEYSDTQNTNTQMALVEVYELLATSMEGGVSGG